MQNLQKFYRWMNLLSVDIVIGAIGSALFFGELLQVRILPYGLIALALTVWIIYTADHLKDARTIQHEASSARHRYHQRHFKMLLVAMIIAMIVDGVIILFTRKPVLAWGIALAIVVAIYLLIQKYLKTLKEMFVAALYTCGVLLPSISVSSKNIDTTDLVIMVMFGFAAWINLLVFSWFDHDQDLADQQASFSTINGRAFTKRFVTLLLVVNAGMFVYILSIENFVSPSLIPMIISLLLFVLLANSAKVNHKFRMLGDALFFLPGLYWLWSQV
jgi:hypothetical protein